MIEKYFKNKIDKNSYLIKATFKADNKNIIEKQYYIYEDHQNNIAYIYLKNKSSFDVNQLKKTFDFINKEAQRDYLIDAKSFKTNKLNEKQIVKSFIYSWYEFNGKEFNLKTNKKNKKIVSILTSLNINSFSNDILVANQICEVKILQNMAPNILTINKFSSYIESLVKNNKKLKIDVLDKNKMKKLGMNLVLSVNHGSSQEAKVIILEYKGNPQSNKKITFVGKGIMFDSGGYNLKTPAKYMIDMKFDMSGAALSILLVNTISKLNIKQNVSCVVCLTDNMVDAKAQVPESIWTSMSGKTVEVANTDAEGRLVLADGLTYAAKILKSSLIIDIATLTGTMFYALGTYTGVWSTNDKYWDLLNKASNQNNEKVWRMPFDEQYIEDLFKNTRADTLSCFNVASPDSSVAATWLKQFVLDKEYIHLDIAASGEKDSKGQAPMFISLIEFVKNFK